MSKFDGTGQGQVLEHNRQQEGNSAEELLASDDMNTNRNTASIGEKTVTLGHMLLVCDKCGIQFDCLNDLRVHCTTGYCTNHDTEVDGNDTLELDESVLAEDVIELVSVEPTDSFNCEIRRPVGCNAVNTQQPLAFSEDHSPRFSPIVIQPAQFERSLNDIYQPSTSDAVEDLLMASSKNLVAFYIRLFVKFLENRGELKQPDGIQRSKLDQYLLQFFSSRRKFGNNIDATDIATDGGRPETPTDMSPLEISLRCQQSSTLDSDCSRAAERTHRVRDNPGGTTDHGNVPAGRKRRATVRSVEEMPWKISSVSSTSVVSEHSNKRSNGVSNCSADVRCDDTNTCISSPAQSSSSIAPVSAHVNLFVNYLLKNDELRQPEEIPPCDLDRYLTDFISGVNVNGCLKDSSRPNSLHSIYRSIGCYLSQRGYGFNIDSDESFSGSRNMLASRNIDSDTRVTRSKSLTSVSIQQCAPIPVCQPSEGIDMEDTSPDIMHEQLQIDEDSLTDVDSHSTTTGSDADDSLHDSTSGTTIAVACVSKRSPLPCSSNTLNVTKSHLRIFAAYLEHKAERRKPEHIPPKELNCLLASFFRDVRKEEKWGDNGSDAVEYEPASLSAMLNSISRHLKNVGYPAVIRHDRRFRSSMASLATKLKQLKVMGKGKNRRHCSPFTPEEIQILLEKNLLGTAIINSLHMLFSVHFSMGRLAHCGLLWGDIQLKSDADGRHCLEFNQLANRTRLCSVKSSSLVGPRIYEDGTALCPVKIYKAYARHRNILCNDPDSRFYLQPKKDSKLFTSDDIWFSPQVMGKNSLGRIMHDMTVAAGLPVRSSLRLSSVAARNSVVAS